MFHTYPEAELPIPLSLAPNGERAWYWIELGIKTTYFFVTATIQTDEGDEFTRHLWFSEIAPVVEIACQSGTKMHFVRLDLFSPGHVNGGEGYRFDQVRQVWRHKKDGATLCFHLADGTTLWHSFHDESANEQDMELLLAVGCETAA